LEPFGLVFEEEVVFVTGHEVEHEVGHVSGHEVEHDVVVVFELELALVVGVLENLWTYMVSQFAFDRCQRTVENQRLEIFEKLLLYYDSFQLYCHM
jgi:hypothetical protein